MTIKQNNDTPSEFEVKIGVHHVCNWGELYDVWYAAVSDKWLKAMNSTFKESGIMINVNANMLDKATLLILRNISCTELEWESVVRGISEGLPDSSIKLSNLKARLEYPGLTSLSLIKDVQKIPLADTLPPHW